MAPFVGAVALVLAQSAAPPAEAAITGVVRDAASGEPIAAAVVTLTDLSRRVATDAGGRYVLEFVPAGPQHLAVRRYGYRPRTLHVLVPGSGRLELNVTLLPDPIPLEPVSVEPRRALRGLTSDEEATFPDREITWAALRGHPTLPEPDAFAGLGGGEVFVEPEVPAGLHVRGAGSDHVGYLLDGVPVLNPYHGAGLFSALNPDALATVRLTATEPSPGHPDALAGAVAARTREPGGRVGVQGALSNTQARVTVDGPGPGAVSWLLGGRVGLLGALAPTDEASYLTGDNHDVLARIGGPALGGHLRLLWYDADNSAATASEVPAEGGASADPGRNRYAWSSRSEGATWIRAMGPGAAIHAGVWRARTGASAGWRREGLRTDLASRREDLGARVSVETRGPDSGTGVGLRFQRVATEYRVSGEDGGSSRDEVRRLTVPTAFAEHSRRLAGSVDAWVAGSASFEAGRLHLAPRMRLRWPADGPFSVTAAFSRMHQFAQSLRNPESPAGHVFPADAFVASSAGEVPVPRSDQLVLAVEARPGGGVRVGAQLFRRRVDDLVLVAPAEDGPFASGGFATGSARAEGASLELAAAGARYALVAGYGLQRVRMLPHESPDAAYTPRHGTAHTVDAGLTFFPAPTAALRVAALAAAGRSGTAFSGPFEWETCNALDGGCEFAGSPLLDGPLGGTRLPAYLRVDVGARKHWHVGVGGRDVLIAAFGTLANVLGRRNVLGYSVDPATGERRPVAMLTRTPLVVGLEARF